MRATNRWLLGAVGVGLLLAACALAPKPGAAPAPAPVVAPSAAPAVAPAPGQAAAGSAAAATQPAARLQALIDAARQEGQLTLTWSAAALGGAEGAARLVDGVNRTYGLNLSVQFTPGPSMPELGSRLLQEAQAGRPATTDVYLTVSKSVLDLMRADAIAPADWTAWAPNVQNPDLLAPNGAAVQVAAFMPGFTYNSSKLTGDAVPRSMDDLLQPRYTGRIASTSYAGTFVELASPEVWGEARTVEYVTKLADQLGGLIRCGEAERLISGEFDLFGLDCGNFDARRFQAQGAPLDHFIPRDAAIIFHWYMTVPKNAAHPAAAKLFINYMLGREAQDYVFEKHYSDEPLVPGSKAVAELEKAQAAGAHFTPVDVAFYQRMDNAEADRITAELQRIVQHQ
ncbi:MAG TPA: ABC transporter substrate-binding protein [Chloroflexota bacterium]|jgi:iron(III) transport system substrate-binding protein